MDQTKNSSSIPVAPGAGVPSEATVDVLKHSQRNSLKVLIDQWKAIDLDGKRNSLDQQASEIADNKDASVNSRKKLAEQTKDFRKLPDSEKIANIGNLLKFYQEEIDRLTKRSKFGENAFISLYKLLAEAPDPVIGLTAALNESQQSSRITELEIENRKIKTELEEFRKEFQEIKNQEVTIRRLEDSINDYEAKMQDIVEERVKANEKALKEEQTKTTELLKDKEQELRRQYNQAQEELSRAQHTLEITQTELLDLKLKYDEKQSANQGELDMLLDELERSRARILVLEREREKMSEQTEFVKVNQFSNFHPSGSTADLELDVAQKDIEITQLKEHIQKLEQQLFGKTNTLKSEVLSLTEQLHQERLKIKSMTDEIKSKPTPKEYEELKGQLDVLRKALEYGGSDDTNMNETKTVEGLLKEKNRKLETENVQLKASVGDLEAQVKDLKDKLCKSSERESEQRHLVQKLEEDIVKGYSQHKNTDDIYLQPQKSKANDEVSMLQIVSNQRDRFKARIMDLEVENKDLQVKLEKKDTELEALKSDNVNLYEKIKYLQSYGTDRLRDLESNRNDQLEEKYSKLYEDSVNPFVIFNRKEKYRRYKELNAAEKVILNSGRFFLSTKYSRTFLFFYSVLLHLLVFLTLYKLAHTNTNVACPISHSNT